MHVNSNATPTANEVGVNPAFEFVKALAVELNAGKLDLPSFPDVAMRVRRALANDNVAIDQVVRIVSSEPALAARMLQLANSAALNPGGKRVVDLRAAIARLGFNLARSATLAFAISQLKRAEAYKGLEKPFQQLWSTSTRVAAVTHMLAKRFSNVNPDTAMLTGLLHGVGKLYLLTHARKFPALFSDPVSYQGIVADWHSNIARAVLESWEMAEEIVDAVHQFEDSDRTPRGIYDLTDVLTVGQMIASLPADANSLQMGFLSLPAARRMRLDPVVCSKVIEESCAELSSLESALGG
jgi:HD-like signal output (HDOD) protein